MRQKRDRSGKKPVQQIPESLKFLFRVDTVLRQKGDTVVAVPAHIAADVAVLESVLLKSISLILKMICLMLVL